MEAVDFSLYIVGYNFIIGLLIMLASEKIGSYAAYFFGSYKKQAARVTHTAALAFGCCIAVLSFGILVFGHWLRV
jgi:hypothetical protein